MTYPITWPTGIIPSEFEYTKVNAVKIAQSPYTLTQKAYASEGKMWSIQAAIPTMEGVNAATFRAFLTRLNGKSGTFLMPIFDYIPRGTWGGTPVINGAGQTGTTLSVSGATISTTGYAKAGDLITLGTGANTYLHEITEDANSNGSGVVALSIWPPLRTSPTNGAAVLHSSSVVGHFRMADDYSYRAKIGKKYEFQTISMYEAL